MAGFFVYSVAQNGEILFLSLAKTKKQLEEALAARAAQSTEIIFDRAGNNPVDDEQKIVLDWYGESARIPESSGAVMKRGENSASDSIEPVGRTVFETLTDQENITDDWYVLR